MTTLGDYLKKEGFTVNDSSVPYGRDATWDKVKWIFVHHTADTCDPKQSDARADYIKNAPSDRYPPLSQIMLGRNQKVYVCAKPRSGDAEPGRASHAGEGSYPGIPTNRANEMAIGIEVQCSGAHALSTHADSYATLIDLAASLCRRYGLNETKVIGHKEYSSTGKIDPRDNMDTIRKDVKAALAGGDGDEGDMKHTVGVSDVPAPLEVAEGTQDFVSWRDVDEDDENLFGSVSFIPDRYVDVDTSGYLKLTGPCRIRVCRYSEDGATYEASYTLLDVPSFADTALPPPGTPAAALASEPAHEPRLRDRLFSHPDEHAEGEGVISGAIDVTVGGDVTVTVEDETGDEDSGAEPEIFVNFGAQGGVKEKKRLRIRIDAIYGPVKVTGGRWIIRYRDHIS
jgi:hypothetical protein